GCLLVRQSYFHNDPKNFADVGGGVLGCRGFHSSFRTTQSGLSLNIDVSTTMIITPGPVVDFLIANQNVRDPYSLDWAKAKRTLKNLRIRTSPSNQEFKITGLSELPCKEQTFTLKTRGGADGEETEVTVYDYFVKQRNIELRYSGDLPCINVGKPKRPTYFPLELCDLVSLQRAIISVLQALKTSNYASEPMLRSCGVQISNSFTPVEGRVLQAPRLKFGNGEDFNPRNGRWNFNNKKIVQPTKIERWAVVNFSARCDVNGLVRDLIKCGGMKGIMVEAPFDVFEEQERKNSELYGPWKKKNLADFGIVTQCIAPTRVNDQYLTNVLLKINAKLGGLNSMLGVEHSPSIPIVSKSPTLILGMDVSHGSPGQSDIPSIAAVVSSREWPLISKYRACVRTQSPKVEMIDNLFKKVSDKDDEGIIRELLIDFYSSSGKRKPDNIIIFRDGVSESQFNQVLNKELDQIIQACKFLDENWDPKFLVIVAQKNHHTKFFQQGSPDNVPPGTVIDNKICHPRNYDFYMCAHAGMIGTTRPTHYHVLLDEIGFSPDDLQELVHSLSYVYQRSTTAISVVAPICYAHLAATQMGQFMKYEDKSETSSSHGGLTAAGAVPVPQLPKLQDNVCNSMFFC
ncbi:Protein argonaute 4A, partial [Stylosanthes scabra]|nr:Protein argonaute 4A [Stylosanthes scabra]